jgi:hypothetical protein
MDNSMCHNNRKVTTQITNAKFKCLLHPLYSPDLSPCDFWLFGILKHTTKDKSLQTVEEIQDAMTVIWEDLTFEDLQRVM